MNRPVVRWLSLILLLGLVTVPPVLYLSSSRGTALPLALWKFEADAGRGVPENSIAQELPAEAVTALRLVDASFPPAAEISLPLPDGESATFRTAGSFNHANGDVTFHARGDGESEQATLTYGEQGIFARITTREGQYLVHTDAGGTWLLDLGDERLRVDDFHADTANTPAPHPVARAALSPEGHTGRLLESGAGSADPARIDLMFIYTPPILERYPGGLLETRFNHLIAMTNQAFVDSGVDAVVRMVGAEAVEYDRSENNPEAIEDLVSALRGEPVPGLEGLDTLRAARGADIVSMSWPHIIGTRFGCGVAKFPEFDGEHWDASMGVNIVNDGASNWSVCTDLTFTHELGHNLNAEHQRELASADDPERYNYAFVRDGRFTSVMAVFGSMHINRFVSLGVFSSPDILCGDEACGSMEHGEGANNALEVSEFAPIIAAYRERAIPGAVEPPDPSEPDSDGDSVSDWLDPYPFDPYDGEEPPDPEPPFEFRGRRLKPGTEPSDYELLVVSSGNDRVLSYALDGAFRGIVAEPERLRSLPVLTEASDLDVDDRGLLYVLASGGVHSYDRFTGRLVDVVLDPTLPEPYELLSFPRAMGLAGDELIVLNTVFIERFDLEGQRTAFPTNAPTKDPDSWTDWLDYLPLTAFTISDDRFYLTESEFNRVMVFDTVTGARMADVAAADNGWITDPRELAVGPDGHLYVANGEGDNVLRFDVENREFIDEFVPPGSGGLSFASTLAFGPDGALYVASRESDEILRFDGLTGEFIDAAVPSGSGGLERPESMIFTPALNELDGGYSGLFYDRAHSGEGFLIEILDSDRALVMWFTFPPQGAGPGGQTWLFGVGRIAGRRILVDEVHSTEGPRFGPGFDPEAVERIPWGTLEVDFNDCDSARVYYAGPAGFGSGVIDVERLTGLPQMPCGADEDASPPQPGAPGISGTWYDRTRSGEGWSLHEIAPPEVLMIWYTYDMEGRQMWLTGVGDLEGNVLTVPDLIDPRGAHFGDDFDPGEVIRGRWGAAQIIFENCESAQLMYQAERPGFGKGELAAVPLTRLKDLECAIDGTGN